MTKPFAILDERVHALQCPPYEGAPELLLMQKPTVCIGTETFVADVVVQVEGRHVVVENHDCPYPGPGSGRRERLLREAGVPVIRLYGEEVADPSCLRRKLRALLSTGVN